MKSSKMVFDLRNWQKDALAPAVSYYLRIVKSGGSESAVFIIDPQVTLEDLGNFGGQGFTLAHLENVSVRHGIPYQLIRLECHEQELYASNNL